MRSLKYILFAVLLCGVFIPGTAAGQAVCGSRAALLKQLQGDYKEIPVSMGLASNGSVVEITRSEQGTWTILRTSPGGVTCLLAAGDYWETLKPVEKRNPS